MRSRIVGWALASAAVSALAGCGPATTAASPTSSPGTSVAAVSPDARGLLSRPVKLPALAAGKLYVRGPSELKCLDVGRKD